jgi:hypothetical protein
VTKPTSRMTRDEIARLDSLHDQTSWTDADLIELNRLYTQFYHSFRHRMFWWQTDTEEVYRPDGPFSPSWEEELSKESKHEQE